MQIETVFSPWNCRERTNRHLKCVRLFFQLRPMFDSCSSNSPARTNSFNFLAEIKIEVSTSKRQPNLDDGKKASVLIAISHIGIKRERERSWSSQILNVFFRFYKSQWVFSPLSRSPSLKYTSPLDPVFLLLLAIMVSWAGGSPRETITQMTVEEFNRFPKLTDGELVHRLTRAKTSYLLDRSVDGELELSWNIDNEWKEMIIGGPLSINYMSVMMITASKKDFPLTSSYNYTLIQSPNSFHRTLVQVASDMRNAFQLAHTSVNLIQTKSRQSSTLSRTALKMFSQASLAMMHLLLPRILLDLKQSANEIVPVTLSSLTQLESVQYLLQEIGEFMWRTRVDNQKSLVHIYYSSNPYTWCFAQIEASQSGSRTWQTSSRWGNQ